MKVLDTLKRLTYQFDMFCSSEMLRYKSQTQYKTFTGGLLSIVIICVITVAFASMIGDTLNRTLINSNKIVSKLSEPTLGNLTPGQENMWMMGFMVKAYDTGTRIDLTQGPQLFTLGLYVYNTVQYVAQVIPVKMEKCTKQHWKIMPQVVDSKFDVLGMNQWACLPLNQSIPLLGTPNSRINSFLGLGIYPCNNATNNNRCAPQKEIDRLLTLYGNFVLSMSYINPVINPNQPNFISYYMDSNDYIIFSKDTGSELWLRFSDYTINSDNSIWPFTTNQVKQGLIVEEKASSQSYKVGRAKPLASIFLAKSANSIVINRQVQKITVVLSYIGGLVGAVTAVLFLMRSYTDSSLEITIGISLFNKEKDQQKKDRFNFFTFLSLNLYPIFKFLKFEGLSKRAQRIQEFQKQALLQLDVVLLVKRIMKLQACISQLLPQKQIEKILENNPITLKSNKKIRALFMNNEQEAENSVKQPNLQEGSSIQCQQTFQKDYDRHKIKIEQMESNPDSSHPMHKNINLRDQIEDQDAKPNDKLDIIKIYRDPSAANSQLIVRKNTNDAE